MIEPTRVRGFRLARDPGRSSASRGAGRRARLPTSRCPCPRNHMPSVGSSSRTIVRPSVTSRSRTRRRAERLTALTAKVTSSTAWTAHLAPSRPLIGKYFVTSDLDQDSLRSALAQAASSVPASVGSRRRRLSPPTATRSIWPGSRHDSRAAAPLALFESVRAAGRNYSVGGDQDGGVPLIECSRSCFGRSSAGWNRASPGVGMLGS